MFEHGARGGHLGDVWPFLALRYGIIAAGVLLWLWETEAEPDTRVIVAAVLFSLMLLLELLVYGGSGPGRRRIVSVSLQLVLSLGAFAARPGAASGLIVCGVLCGVAATAPWVVAAVCLGLVATVNAVLMQASLSTVVSLVALYVLALAVGRLFMLRFDDARTHHTTIEQLETAQQRIAEFTETTRQLAAMNERQRLAEELHDTLGHALVGTLLHVQIARKTLSEDPTSAAERLGLVETNVRNTLEQVREALRRGTQRRAQLPLHMALESIIADFAATGGPWVELTFRPDVESVADVSPAVADVLYRTTQEALTNAVRHGQAERIDIELEVSGRRLYLRIRDDGVGAEHYAAGMGLTGMVSRVQAVGGTLRFETAPGQGFQVEVGVRRA